MRARSIQTIVPGRPVMDGGGVRLKRTIGTAQLPMLDPFLLLDEFRSDNPNDYAAGFPSHPHRGFETVTYMLAGQMEHQDSVGNTGRLGPGSVQWMTAGAGIIHSEMPQQVDGLIHGFQLWVNLPGRLKLCAPRYQDLPASSVPEVALHGGGFIRVIAGRYGDTVGPVRGVSVDPMLLDVRLPPATGIEVPIPTEHAAFAYVFEGSGVYGVTETSAGEVVARGHVIVLGPGEALKVLAAAQGTRFLVVSGRTIGEPVTRYGPFVMNTKEEIAKAVDDFHAGRFDRRPATPPG